MSEGMFRWLLFFVIFMSDIKPSLGSESNEVEQIRTFQYAVIREDSLSFNEILRQKKSFSWMNFRSGDALLRESNTQLLTAFKLPRFDFDELILRIMFSDSRDIKAFVFDEDSSNFRELASLPDRYTAFSIPREHQGKNLLYITKIPGISLYGPVEFELVSRHVYQKMAERDRTYIGLVLGVISIMIIYNSGMLLLFRKAYLLYYIFYCISAAMQFSGTSGLFGFQALELGLGYYAANIFTGCFAIIFSMTFLNIKRESKLSYWIGVHLLGTALVFLAGCILNYRFFVENFATLAFPILGYCTFLAARAAYNGYKPAYAMLFGWSGLWLSFTLVAMQWMIPGFPAMGWGPPIAISFEIATFSFAMGQKLRMSELKVMKENQHAFSEMAKMVYPHQLSGIRHGKPLEETMPTTTAQACVLSFDIVGSSKIQHVNAKVFFRNTFTRCNEIISEGYDGKSLRANAYRIKEMGDGFLCSVGYPFQAMSNNLAHDAVDLAKRFAKVLHEEQKMLHSETPIACGIGIALDTITGFYPEAGTKEYDLYGQAIVLATRYEGMRKTLFEAEKGRSVLIIQEKVFQSLDPSHRLGFIAMDLKELGVVVRDDPAATKLYYQFLDETLAKAETLSSHLRVV